MNSKDYRRFALFSVAGLLLLSGCNTKSNRKNDAKDLSNAEKTAFQTSAEWRPTIDVRSDVAIVYGTGVQKKIVKGVNTPSIAGDYDLFENRVKSWQDKGYETDFMTGIAWGTYQDYFTGKWDGKTHWDEAQVKIKNDTVWHGKMMPYIVPTDNFLKYMEQAQIKRVIDAGVSHIFLEEPEFWAWSGYSDAFKREWKKYYGSDWQPQDKTAENTYLSNKLKYHLFYNAINKVFSYAKAYGKSKGMDVKCYVATHSLVNYSQWKIVSPEASLASLPCVDGYIAQVWTGTSRVPNYYNGVEKERVFENAFFEYGSMKSMTEPTHRKLFFLTDPIEDNPNKDWDDYRRNYEATFTAEVLYPSISNYEVMPWPERIYEGLYQKKPGSTEMQHIPQDYAAQMQIMINSLNKIPKSDNKVSGSHGISVLMSNSLMFQRFPLHNGYDDPQLSNFYGMAFPFLKRGVPVSIAHIENLKYKATLANTKVLLMTYSNMKPLHTEMNTYLADWVKAGGKLVYVGKDDDPFQKVKEWWNTNGNKFKCPSEDLFLKMGMKKKPKNGTYAVGAGSVTVVRQDPKYFVMKKDKDGELLDIVEKLYAENGNKLDLKNNFSLNRGYYKIISVMDESVSDAPYTANGLYIDLFNPNLPIIQQKVVHPGQESFLIDLKKVSTDQPMVLASSARTYDETYLKGSSYSFVTKGPSNTLCNMRVLLPQKPQNCTITDQNGKPLEHCLWNWDELSHTGFVSYANSTKGINVKFIF